MGPIVQARVEVANQDRILGLKELAIDWQRVTSEFRLLINIKPTIKGKSISFERLTSHEDAQKAFTES